MKTAEKLVTLFQGGVAGDTTRPTVAITSTAATITAAAFTVTVTFSEPVVGFDASKITVGNGSAGTVSGTGPYTSVITPTATGTVTVDIADGAVADPSGNTNTAATQFSILYVASVLWVDFSDISKLFQNTGRTTAVTTDGQSILGYTDKSGTNNHLSNAAGPVYKTNIQNGLSAALFTSASSQYLTSASDIISAGSWTMITAGKTVSGQINFHGQDAASTSRVLVNTTTAANFYTDSVNITGSGISMTDATITIAQYNSTGPVGRFRFNGSATWYANNALAAYVPKINVFYAQRSSSGYYNGYGFERFYFAGILNDTQINAVRAYLNTKWSIF